MGRCPDNCGDVGVCLGNVDSKWDCVEGTVYLDRESVG